jgi:Family of unknown function (DUF5372)
VPRCPPTTVEPPNASVAVQPSGGCPPLTRNGPSGARPIPVARRVGSRRACRVLRRSRVRLVGRVPNHSRPHVIAAWRRQWPDASRAVTCSLTAAGVRTPSARSSSGSSPSAWTRAASTAGAWSASRRCAHGARPANAACDSLVVTHPFHPLRGQRLAIFASAACQRGGCTSVRAGHDRRARGGDRSRAGAGVDAAQRRGARGAGRAGGGDRRVGPAGGKARSACARTSYRLMTGEVNLRALSERQLRARRRRLAAALERLGATLPGLLVRQGRRCSSRGCRCRRDELHGPYLYLALYSGGRNRPLYVPAAVDAVVADHVAATRRTSARWARSRASTSSCCGGGRSGDERCQRWAPRRSRRWRTWSRRR